MFSNKYRFKTCLGSILGRFGRPKGVVLGGLLGLKLGQKRLGKVMRKKASSWSGLGGGEGIAVRSLGAGSDKGETELRLPLRLFFGFA